MVGQSRSLASARGCWTGFTKSIPNVSSRDHLNIPFWRLRYGSIRRSRKQRARLPQERRWRPRPTLRVPRFSTLTAIPPTAAVAARGKIVDLQGGDYTKYQEIVSQNY